MMLPPFIAQLPRLSLSSSVILIRNIDVLPRSLMFCPLLFFAWSRVAVCLVAVHVPQGCVWIAELQSLYFLRLCVGYTSRGALLPPDQNSTIKNSPEAKIGMYTRFIEFANYRVPLSKFLLCVLEYYQISLSQLSVIGAAKVSHFDIMCQALGRIPTVDASVCPLSIPWFDGTSVVNYSLPIDEVVDLPCAELLNKNRTLIRKYPETFLCLVGLSGSFVEMDVRPTLLRDDDEEMGLLDFVKAADPFKVKIGERTLAENEVPLITETEDRVIVPSPQPMSLVDRTIQDELNVNSGKKKKRVAFASGSPPTKKAQTEGIVISYSRPSTAGESPSALQRLSRQNEQASTGSGSAAPATEDVTSSFATPTPEFAHEDASRDNVVPPVTLDSAGVNAPVAASTGGDHRSSGSGPKAGVLSATPSQDSFADDFYESQTIDSATAQNFYVLNWNVINNDRLASPVTCRNLLDHVTPPSYWVACNILYFQVLRFMLLVLVFLAVIQGMHRTRMMKKLLVMMDEEDLEHFLEHDVSSYHQANPGE
ncbi:hypothetical protein Tco_0332322 [Tanacetum coccineum]